MKPATLAFGSATALLAFSLSPAMAVNKCVNDAGQVVYQSAPCPATIKGGELILQKVAPASASSPADAEELKRIQQTTSILERERRLIEIDREIQRLEGRIVDHRSAMDGEMAHLRRKKQFANNNLADATWEQSISQEMNGTPSRKNTMP